jgi:glutathione S-transferase
MLELYHYDRSTAAQKVRILLAEKGLDWTSHIINTSAAKREHLTEEYLKVNPRGLVPTLVHDGEIVMESQIILEYIEDVFPEPSYRPENPILRARMRQWTRQIEEGFHVDSRVLGVCIVNRHSYLKNEEGVLDKYYSEMKDYVRRRNDLVNIEKGLDSPLLPNAVHRFKKTFSALNEALDGNEWLLGDMLTLADISYVVYLTRLESFQMAPLWSNMTNLTRWHQQFKQRESYELGIVKWGDSTTEARIKHGTEAFPRIKELWDAAGD